MSSHRPGTRTIAAAIAAVALLGPAAGTSGAQTSAGSQYTGRLGEQSHGGPGAAAGATLPFTGLDLGGVAGTGVVLIGAGALLRRRRAPDSGTP